MINLADEATAICEKLRARLSPASDEELTYVLEQASEYDEDVGEEARERVMIALQKALTAALAYEARCEAARRA